jgi:hypothetical protein
MKRIGLVHYEFLNEGLPAALHVNGEGPIPTSSAGPSTSRRARRSRTLLTNSERCRSGKRSTSIGLSKWLEQSADHWARGLAVILHRMWTDGTQFRCRKEANARAPPLRNQSFADSPLEEKGFEPSVPPRKEAALFPEGEWLKSRTGSLEKRSP